MTAINDVTGDSIKSRANTKSFQDNFDAIFGKRSQKVDASDNKRKILAPGDGSISGVSSACDGYGNTDLTDDGNIK
jgi:hypothetical protein